MQTLWVQKRSQGSTSPFKFYPALMDKRLSKKTVADQLALLDRCQWEVLSYSVIEDGKTRTDEQREYRALCRAERRRGA